MKKIILLYFILLLSNGANCAIESDSSYNLYKDKIVLYSDLGFRSAPFNLRNNFNEDVKNLKFKHNQKAVLGFGINYKWFGFRLGIGLPGNLKPVSRFGESRFFDLGVKFNIKQTFWDVDFRNYNGYAIKDAYKWNDSLDKLKPNDIRKNTSVASFSINSWYFRSKAYKMQSVLGIVGDFNKTTGTWYFKSSFNIFGVGNNNKPLTPTELIDTTLNRNYSSTLSAIDIGFVPGYAYTYRQNNWQASMFGGLGAVIQAKFYNATGNTRGLLGLAPRIDLRFVAGYSKPKYFFWLGSDFDFKSISFRDVKYNQVFYTLNITGGVRLDKKQKTKRKD